MSIRASVVRAGEVTADLALLTVRERAVASRCHEVNAQIDLLSLSDSLTETDLAKLERLESTEREISKQRRRLQGEIDRLREFMGLAPGAEPAGLDHAA